MSFIASRLRGLALPIGLAALLCLPGGVGAEMIEVAANGNPTGMVLQAQTRGGVQLAYQMDRFGIEAIDIDGASLQQVILPGSLLPNDAGAPNLPGVGRTLALPQGATAVATITASETRTYTDVDLAPAAPIQFENDDTPATYVRNAAIYGRNANYPATPVVVSEPWQIRGVDVVSVGVTPFQYNPITRELTVYTRLEFRVDFVGGNAIYGEDRLRNRYWEPMLRDHLLNYSALPEIDFTRAAEGGRNGYEYVIICPDDATFAGYAEQIKEWRTLQGISTEVFTLSEVGGTTTAAIESFLNNAYNTWSTPPVAFLILGDYPSSGDDYAVTAPFWSGYCVSDNIYADVNGDNLPDMVHARITAHSETHLQNTINRVFDFETNPITDPTYYQKPIIAGGWQTERWFILCCEVCYGFMANELGMNPTREYAIYSGYPGTQWSSNSNTSLVVNYFGPNGLGYIPATPQHLTDWGGNASRIIADLNAGSFMLLHRDHGSESGWGEPAFGSNNLNSLTTDEPPFVFSINCLTGKYNWSGECFTEKWHRMNHGALGLIAASEVSYSFVNDAFIWGMWDSLWPEFDPGYGDSDNVGPADLMPAFAMASGKHYLQASSFPYNPQHKVYTHHLFHHHGDAFIRMNTQVPLAMSIVHDDHLEIDATTFTVRAPAGAVIALTVDGQIIGVGDGTGSPLAVPIVPQTEEGELRIVVTAANSLRYDETLPIEAGSILVAPDGSGDYPTIQAAIDDASEGNLILLADGIYQGDGNRDLDTQGKLLTIESLSGNAAACIIDCQGSEVEPHRGFRFHSGETGATILRKITIRNGWGPGECSTGGAILCENASPNLIGCIFQVNHAERGGAIACSEASPILSSCLFENNEALFGAALLCEQSSNPWVTMCTFRDNEAGTGTVLCDVGSAPQFAVCGFYDNVGTRGAGLACLQEAHPTLNNCTFSGNVVGAGGLGGAVACLDATVTLQRCNFYDNQAEVRGGAIDLEASVLTASYCTFAGNQSAAGGALAGLEAQIQLTSSTFYGNDAVDGSAVRIDGGSATLARDIFSFGLTGAAFACGGGETLSLSCCDIYGNAGGDWTGCIADLSGVDGNFSLDPAFCDEGVRDFSLYNHTPCVQYACGTIGAFPIECFETSGAEEQPLVSVMLLESAQPNPFARSTAIAFRIPAGAQGERAVLEVFDATGRLVRALHDGPVAGGAHSVSWDGTDVAGAPVASGVYYYQLRVGDLSETKQMILTR